MKTKYITPKVTVVPFAVEEGFWGTVGNSSTMQDAVIFQFFETYDDGSAFGNDHFNNMADDNSNYNFFGD